MKSVVLEIKDGYVAVLSDDGCITKIKNNGYKVGQVINLKTQKALFTKKRIAWLASAATLAMVSGVGAWAYMSPYSYVSLDVNPSIEFSINRFDRVIDVTAVNDDGEDILDQMNNLDNKDIETAVIQTVNQIEKDGYFESSEDNTSNEGTDIDGGIIITTSGDDQEKAESLADSIEETVQTEMKDLGVNVVVEVDRVEQEQIQEAKKLGITPGKLNLIEKMKASSPDPNSIIIEDWSHKSVKEIMKATKAIKKAQKEAATTDDTPGSTEPPLSTDDTPETTKTPLSTEDPSATIVPTIETPSTETKDGKITEKEENSDEKDKTELEKSSEKAKKETEKETEKTKKDTEKNTGKAKKDTKKNAEKAKKDAKKAKEDAENAKKDAEKKAETDKKKAESETEKAKEDTEQESQQTEPSAHKKPITSEAE